MTYLLGWKDILRPIRDGYRHLFPSPDTGPTPAEREKQRQLDFLKGFTYFDTFDQLETWTEAEADPIQRANTPLLSRSSSASPSTEDKANVLLCHDCSGNYHDYEASSAVGVDEQFYSCEYLQYVESFIYFSHKLVCVPPPSWTNTLHRNGAKAFGTLLIEPQTKDSDRLLRFTTKDEDGRANNHFPLAKKLSDIAKHYGFDGWLVNVEKPFSQRSWDLNMLVSFLGDLKEAMGDARELIWYDALTIDNKVAYQNALTPKYLPFATTCRAVLTNYCWKEGEALSSKDLALKHNIPLEKLYFGVDVWAQNKTSLTHPRITYPEFSGGGTNTGIAVSKLAETGLSVGIFAPAWSFEHFPSRGRSAERAMWAGHSLPDDITCSCGDTNQRHPTNREHAITRSGTLYPAGSERFFYTDFSRAFSQHTETEAKRMYENKWLHSQLSSQSILPHMSTASAKDDHGNALDIISHYPCIGRNKASLVVKAGVGDVYPSTVSLKPMYERYLPLFKLDMPADGSLQLMISCAYFLKMPDAVTSFYLKFTKGIKLMRLEVTPRGEVQVIDCTISSIQESDKQTRLQELGVHVHAGAFAEDPTLILEVDEIRIVPRIYLAITCHYLIRNVSIEKRGEGDTEHWRLRWACFDHRGENGISPAIAGVPHSDITGPFSYFVIQMDGVELGRAYALEHVLPNHLVAGFGPKGVRVVLIGVGFDGRELARYDRIRQT